MSDEQEEVPVHEGPDPHKWPGRDDIWPLAEDLRQADAMLELLNGKVARDNMPLAFQEARHLVRAITEERAVALSLALLAAYGVPVPEEQDPPATEATGGFRGDGDGKGTGDHLRRVQG